MVDASRIRPVDDAPAAVAGREAAPGSREGPRDRPAAPRATRGDGLLAFAISALGLSALAWAFWTDLADGWRGLLPVLALGVLVPAAGVPGRTGRRRVAGAALGVAVAFVVFGMLALRGLSSS